MLEGTLSKDFFNYDPFADCAEGIVVCSWRGRLFCFLGFFRKLLILPFALFIKAVKSFFRFLGVGFALAAVFLTLGLSCGARSFLLERMVSLGSDAADWMLLPFAIVICLVRLLVGAAVSPCIFFRV